MHIISALKLLSDPANLPAVVSCKHGKDRTGFVSALVQIICGVSREEIFQGYAASAVCQYQCLAKSIHQLN